MVRFEPHFLKKVAAAPLTPPLNSPNRWKLGLVTPLFSMRVVKWPKNGQPRSYKLCPCNSNLGPSSQQTTLARQTEGRASTMLLLRIVTLLLVLPQLHSAAAFSFLGAPVGTSVSQRMRLCSDAPATALRATTAKGPSMVCAPCRGSCALLQYSAARPLQS